MKQQWGQSSKNTTYQSDQTNAGSYPSHTSSTSMGKKKSLIPVETLLGNNTHGGVGGNSADEIDKRSNKDAKASSSSSSSSSASTTAKEKKQRKKSKRLHYKNGDAYEGDVGADGRSHGRGSLRFKEGGWYRGGFERGVCHGKGTRKHANGDAYHGQWVSGRMEGRGVFHWAAGHKYEGGWKDDHYDGLGTFHWADGRRYEGQFKCGKKVGKGTFHFADGGRYEGNWQKPGPEQPVGGVTGGGADAVSVSKAGQKVSKLPLSTASGSKNHQSAGPHATATSTLDGRGIGETSDDCCNKQTLPLVTPLSHGPGDNQPHQPSILSPPRIKKQPIGYQQQSRLTSKTSAESEIRNAKITPRPSRGSTDSDSTGLGKMADGSDYDGNLGTLQGLKCVIGNPTRLLFGESCGAW
jgi:hypothetical protein